MSKAGSEGWTNWQACYEDAQRDCEQLTDKLHAAEAQLAEAERALKQIMDVGHDDDCIMCGFKDRRVDMYFDAARITDSAEDGTKHHPNCTPPCGICEPDEWEKAFLGSAVDPVDGI